MASLRYILLLQRDVPRAVRFYAEGLGLPVRSCTERWAELQAGPARLALKAVDGEAFVSVGYSPLLSFDVRDLDATVNRCLQLGGKLDGPIRYPESGKIAALRAPDGHMIGLFESSSGGGGPEGDSGLSAGGFGPGGQGGAAAPQSGG